jgi:hypothetical protein
VFVLVGYEITRPPPIARNDDHRIEYRPGIRVRGEIERLRSARNRRVAPGISVPPLTFMPRLIPARGSTYNSVLDGEAYAGSKHYRTTRPWKPAIQRAYPLLRQQKPVNPDAAVSYIFIRRA